MSENNYLEDILNTFKQVEENFALFYSNISNIEGKYNEKIKNIAKVLAREEKRHVKFYEDLLVEFKNDPYIIIEKDIYIKGKQLLMDFKKDINTKNIDLKTNLLEIALKYEERNADIIREIIDILEEQNLDINGKFISLLQILLDEEKKHANNLRLFIKNN